MLNIDQRLLIDKISFTVPLTKVQRERVFNDFVYNKVYKQFNGRVYSALDAKQKNKHGYKNRYSFNISDNNIVYISFYPIDPSHNFLRIEYNPTNLKKEGRIKLRSLLLGLFGVNIVKRLYFHAVVTRLDIAIDVYDMQKHLLIQANRMDCSNINRNGVGSITSQILGSENSDCRITMYDKNREREIIAPNNHQRVEERLRNLNCSINELDSSLLQSLKNVNFYNKKLLNDDYFSKDFLFNVVNDGLNYALSKCDRNTKIRYRRRLESHHKEYPIKFKKLSFQKAHRGVFRSLVHRGYESKFMNTAIAENELFTP